ncbi:MAG: hypothetical protein DI546_01670 [Rhizobium sp.]|nr:MAG: hypothetical protein DI546_01670 [Rhizobium sp.]
MAIWTQEDDEMLVAAAARGLAASQISIPGHTRKSVSTRMSRLGLSANLFVTKPTCWEPNFLPHGRHLRSANVPVFNRVCPDCKPCLQSYAE